MTEIIIVLLLLIAGCEIWSQVFIQRKFDAIIQYTHDVERRLDTLDSVCGVEDED